MRKALLIVGIALLLVGLVYRRAPINFLRSESGWYLRTAYSDEATQQNLERGFFRFSYGGHYTPLVFLTEFKTTGLIGTNGTAWLVRQLLATGLLAALAFAVAYQLGRVFQLDNPVRITLGIGLGAVTIFQRAMIDLIGWPFMILQLIWMSCALLVLYSFGQIAEAPNQKKWIWISALVAYFSLHISGLGLVLVAGVTTGLAGLLIVAIRSPQSNAAASQRSIVAALVTMLVLTGIHGWAMTHFLPFPPHTPPPIHRFDFILLCIALSDFAVSFLMAGIETFTRTGFATDLDWRGTLWLFAPLLVAGTIVLYFWALRRAKKDPTPIKISALLLNAYTLSGFWVLVALVAARELHFRSVDEMFPQLAHYVSVPRYVGPLHFVLLGSALYLAVALSRKIGRPSVIIWAGVAAAVVLAQIGYLKSYQEVAPRGAISHTKVWREILGVVQDCRKAQIGVPDFPMDKLTQEFTPSSLSTFEPVLRHDLNLNPGEIRFIPWDEYLSGSTNLYQALPRVDRLRKKLELEPED